MLTADEIKALTPEQKIELKKLLDEQQEVVVSTEQPKVDETIVVVQTEEKTEVVEEKTEEVVEPVVTKVEEPVMPNFEEKFSAFDKRVQEAEERFKAELEKRDKTIAKLEASNEELQRTRPTGGVQPKVSNPLGDERKATEDKMLEQFKKGYVNKQIQQLKKEITKMAFSDFTGLSVGSTALEIGVANIILKKMIQQQLYRDGIGITEVYSNGATAGGAVLRVPKVTASTSSFRQLGATVNGNFFNGNSIGVIGLGEELLVCNNIYDACEDVPQAQHVLSLGGAAALGVRAEEIAKNIARQMNAGTMAYQIAAVLNAVITASGTETDRIFTYNPATAGDPLAKFLDACASLDNGDTYNDVFPSVGRLAL